MSVNNAGALIDLSQISNGEDLKRVIRDFDRMQSSVKRQINTTFRKEFNELDEKYKVLEAILKGNLDAINESYSSELNDLKKRFEHERELSDNKYMPKSGLISMEQLDEDLREKIYEALMNSGGSSGESGYMKDYHGNLKKIKWEMYFVAFSNKIVYLNSIKNDSYDESKVPTTEDWYGENYEKNDFSSNCVELYVYNRPAETYLPLFYLPATGDYDPNETYYELVNDTYVTWLHDNYYGDDWETIRQPLYVFNEVAYENELIAVLKNNKFPMTYVFRNLGSYDELVNPDEKNRIEPVCGKASYNEEAKRITFDSSTQSRYVFKLVKYEY